MSEDKDALDGIAEEHGYKLPPELEQAILKWAGGLRPKTYAKLQVTENGHLWLHLDPGEGQCKASLNLTLNHEKYNADSIITRALTAMAITVARRQSDDQD